tara:strand:- start:856 stop:1521 length:666 start_codon:yes stop_codon:yes gene_type:complete
MKAIIPVRKGSVRVKNKNVRPFCNKNILIYKIKQLRRISQIEEVIVNSDCEYMLKLASKYGATPLKRDDYYASSGVPINEVWKNIAENTNTDTILYANATSPLVEDKSFIDSIQMYHTLGLSKEQRSLNSVTTVKEFLWMNGSTVNYDQDRQPKSQDLPLVFHPNFAINIISRELMIKDSTIISKDFKPYFLGKIESIDIDDEEDFLMAELLYKRKLERRT